ncbi:MAG: hypothetical protein HS132_01885 [Planctomycetia bacterium]|nr:hypothetical protein [Planctomycetia bacterium]
MDKARVFAIDISPDALSVAAMNAQRHEVLNQITFYVVIPLNPSKVTELKQRPILSYQTPYVSRDEFTLQREVGIMNRISHLSAGKMVSLCSNVSSHMQIPGSGQAGLLF